MNQGKKPQELRVLSGSEAAGMMNRIPDWSLAGDRIERELTFRDFRQAMEFVNQVAAAAEQENHHPDILISYNRVRLTLTTHKIGGLSEKDFTLAAGIDLIAARLA